MNTKAFAVAAVFGASAALASECPEPAALPTDFNDLSWRAQAVAKFTYMDSCPQDDKLSYKELLHYSGDVPRGLLQGDDPASGLDQVFFGMLRMDMDQNQQVSLGEYLRRAQTDSSPITVDFDDDEVFNYMTCKPQQDAADKSANCLQSYDRADLRACIQMLEDIGPIVNHETTIEGRLEAYEVFVNKEMQLRDYNKDGQITREEHDRHKLQKQMVKDLFDQLKNIDHQYICRDNYGYLGNDHPWLHYYGANEAFDWMDANKDDLLSFQEVFQAVQLDDIHWRRFDDFFRYVDQDGDDRVQKSEMLAFTASFYGQFMTLAETEELGEKLFSKFNRSSIERDGQQVIERNEFWLGSALDQEADDHRLLKEANLPYQSRTGWIAVDSDHDDIVIASDLIGVMEDANIREIYQMMGKTSASDAVKWAEFYEKYVLHEFYGLRRLEKVWMNAIHDGEASYTFTLADVSNDRARTHLKLTQADLEKFFNRIDLNSDGEVDGEEACRAWTGGWGFRCHKWAPEHSSDWIAMVEDWAENPIGYN